MKKKKIAQIIFISISIGSLYFVPWILVKAWILPIPDSIEGQVEETLDYGFEGMLVYVNKANEPSAFYAGGWKDRDNKVPADPKSLFKIASISKLYVAVSVTKLVKQGKLSFEDNLSEYFPELIERIENAERINLKMLIQHRSGIPNFTDNPDFWEDNQGENRDALDYALDLPAHFEPGTSYRYSNTNYLLLRRIMDKVLGYNHERYIKQNILIPLDLKNTYFSIQEVNLEDVMSGYYVGYEEDFKEEENGMLATAEDVGIFLRALNEGTVFSEGEQEMYPYEYNHGGLVVGYQSLAEYHEDIDAVVVQFLNTTDFEGYEWNLSEISMSRIVKILQRENK